MFKIKLMKQKMARECGLVMIRGGRPKDTSTFLCGRTTHIRKLIDYPKVEEIETTGMGHREMQQVLAICPKISGPIERLRKVVRWNR